MVRTGNGSIRGDVSPSSPVAAVAQLLVGFLLALLCCVNFVLRRGIRFICVKGREQPTRDVKEGISRTWALWDGKERSSSTAWKHRMDFRDNAKDGNAEMERNQIMGNKQKANNAAMSWTGPIPQTGCFRWPTFKPILHTRSPFSHPLSALPCPLLASFFQKKLKIIIIICCYL